MTHSHCRDVGVGMSDEYVGTLSTCADTRPIYLSDIPTSDTTTLTQGDGS